MKIQFICGLIALSALGSANMLTNGDFESPAVDVNAQRNEWTAGQTFDGWNVVAADYAVEQLSNTYADNYGGDFWWKTTSGDQFIYLASFTTVSQIRQDVTLAAGDYTLSFMQCAFRGSFGTPEGVVTTDLVDGNGVSVLGGAQVSTTDPYADWHTVSYSFTVTTPGSYGVEFLSSSGSAGNIDNVQLNPVPEPASLAALGMGAIAVLRRRKRA